MVRAFYNEKPEAIKYMPLPNSRMADVRLRVNITEVQTEECTGWEADEHYFRAAMTRDYVEQHFDELLDYVPVDPEEETTESLLLQMTADHEYRLCLLEMGVDL